MNHPALKGEVSINKMESQITPRLRRSNVVLNSFGGCISNTSKEFSGTPEMSFPKVISQPRMFLQQHKRRIALKQLKSFTNTHCNWHLNKQMDMINSDVKFVNFESMFASSFSDKELTINSNTIELHGVFGIFTFPDKMESILSETMFKRFQIHFFPPKSARRNIAHANFTNLVQEPNVRALYANKHQELNLVEDGNSSLCLKAEVSLPLL